MGVTDFVITVLGTAGGMAAIIGGLTAWLGKVWATRIAMAEKGAHDKELARLNSSLEAERNRVEEAHKRLLEVTTEIDLDLRKRRIDVYIELWESTELLHKWPREEGVTYEDLRGFSKSLRDWYFKKGGMFLSRTTFNKAYAPLQDAIRGVLEKHPKGNLNKEDYDDIRSKCSSLRTFLANDVLSRRAAPSELVDAEPNKPNEANR